MRTCSRSHTCTHINKHVHSQIYYGKREQIENIISQMFSVTSKENNAKMSIVELCDKWINICIIIYVCFQRKREWGSA